VQGKSILSKKGIDECVNRMIAQGYIFEEHTPTVEQCPVDERYFIFYVQVKLSRLLPDGSLVPVRTVIGNKRQCKFNEDRNGNPQQYQDRFCYEKGLQKAIRNANKRLIPIVVETEVVKAATSGNRVMHVQPPVNRITPPQQTRQIPQRQQKALPVNKEYLAEAAAYQQQQNSVTHDVTLDSLLKNQDWMVEAFPWKLRIVVNGAVKEESLKWEELGLVETVQTKQGKQMSLRQYLHILEGNDNRKTALRAAAALEIFKAPVSEQAQMFDTSEAEQDHSDPA
jgi:hypothetical protein